MCADHHRADDFTRYRHRWEMPLLWLSALIAMIVTVAAGLAVTWTALSAKPAPYLRNE